MAMAWTSNKSMIKSMAKTMDLIQTTKGQRSEGSCYLNMAWRRIFKQELRQMVLVPFHQIQNRMSKASINKPQGQIALTLKIYQVRHKSMRSAMEDRTAIMQVRWKAPVLATINRCSPTVVPIRLISAHQKAFQTCQQTLRYSHLTQQSLIQLPSNRNHCSPQLNRDTSK